MIRVALIGYGYVGRTFHVPLIQTTPGLDLAVISIATPNDSHVSIAAMALRADKHVVVDKHSTEGTAHASSGDAGRARAVASLARSLGRILTVFQNRRWDGDFLALTHLVAGGELGEVTHF